MALSDMQVFEEFAYGAATETIQQNVDLFNGSSAGTIVLVPGDNSGDFSTETFWQNISGLVRRRDAYGSGAVAEVPISQEEMTSVKVAGGTPEIKFDINQLTWIQKNPQEAGVVIGEQLGLGITQNMINTAILSATSAIGGQASLVYDGTTGSLSRSGLVMASAAFGDRSDRINAWITHSKSLHDLMGENVANANRLFQIGNISIREDGYGRPIIMTDSPALTYDDGGARYRTAGLVPMAVTVEDNGDLFTNVQTDNGSENIKRSMQSEFSFNVKVAGYTWDKTNGGASPADAALGASTNWDMVATDVKNTAGVMLNTQ
jgi:hypothetical protein